MEDGHHFLAIDLGAEYGRAMLVRLVGGKADSQEIHCWANRPAVLAGTHYWDLPGMFNEILAALSLCADQELQLTSIGVDTWGVDFGLLDHTDRLAT